MPTLLRLAPLAVLAAATPPVLSQSLVDDFSPALGGSFGGWTFDAPTEIVERDPVTNEFYLRATGVHAVRPYVRTESAGAASNPFLGDWRAREIRSFGFDVTVFSVTGQPFREPTLILSNGSCEVFLYLNAQLPAAGAGWASFDFPIDFASPTLPPMWQATTGCGDAHAAWNAVITNVTEVRVSYGDPSSIAVAHTWDTAVDRMRLQEGIGAYSCDATYRNSRGLFGRLVARGSTDVAQNDLDVTMTDISLHSYGFLIVSETAGFVPSPTVQPPGRLCITGSIGRFVGQIRDSGATGTTTTSVDLTAMPQPMGSQVVLPGDTWYFQGWHRDVGPQGQPTSYFTNSLGVTFQ